MTWLRLSYASTASLRLADSSTRTTLRGSISEGLANSAREFATQFYGDLQVEKILSSGSGGSFGEALQRHLGFLGGAVASASLGHFRQDLLGLGRADMFEDFHRPPGAQLVAGEDAVFHPAQDLLGALTEFERGIASKSFVQGRNG